MKFNKLVLLFVLIILLSTFLSTIVRLHLFIQTLPYIFVAFGIYFPIMIIYFAMQWKRKKIAGIEINLLDTAILVFVLYLLIRYFSSPLYNAQPDKILFFICLAGIYISIVKYFNGREKQIVIIVYLIILSGLFQVTYALLQFFGIIPDLLSDKLGGTYGNSGDLANFLAIIYILSLGLFFYEKKKLLRYLLLVSIIANLFYIVVSFSRTSWIACLVVSLIIIYYSKFSDINFRKISLRKKYLLAFIFLFIIIVGILGSFELYRMKSSSADGRIFIWKNCLHLIKEKKLFGHGYESFMSEIRHSQLYYFKNNPNDIKRGLLADDIFFAYNDYLKITVEYGIIGLVLLLFIIFRAFSFKNLSESETRLSLLTIIRVSLLTILISMLFSYPLHNHTIVICFFVFLASVSVFDKNQIMKIKIKDQYVLAVFLATFVFSVFLLVYASNSFSNGLKWNKAFADYEKNTGNYLAKYDGLFHALIKDKSFIMNYGYILFNSGNYERCIDIYEKYGYLCLSSDMYLTFGASYEKTKNYEKAVENYKNASFLVPHLFMPKYRLFKLYCITNQTDKADSIAQQISTMKIKIFSDEVKDIKTEINKYLFLKK
jgi:O-antigen polymerase